MAADMDDTEEITDLSNPDSMAKYKQAATIANEVLAKVIEEMKPGKKIVDMCALGDKLINDAVSKIYNKSKVEKGVAFPTCVSVNNVVGHYSPLADDKAILQLNDIAKIDLGVQLDGYIAVVAHTIVVTDGSDEVKDKKGDLFLAAYTAVQTVTKMLVPGTKNSEITATLQKIADTFHVNLVEGVLSHEMKRFIIDGNNVIISKALVDQKVEEFEIEPNCVYAIDIVMTTGEGKAKETDIKTTIYKRAVNQQYRLKLKASRYVFNEINQRFPTFPFTVRALDEAKGKLGITEMVSHGLLDPYPVLFEKAGETVVQFKTTVLVTPKGPTAVTFGPRAPHAESQYKLAELDVKTAPVDVTAKKKKKKAKKKAKTVQTPVPDLTPAQAAPLAAPAAPPASSAAPTPSVAPTAAPTPMET